jgi:hypothetical protein
LPAASWNDVLYITTSDCFQKARFCEIPEYHHEECDRSKSRHLEGYCGGGEVPFISEEFVEASDILPCAV